MMTVATLRHFLRPHLDVLFVALNPPKQSNSNGHYFSGTGSRFFELLQQSRLITRGLSKAHADKIVFGSTNVNYCGKEFGVVDLVPAVVETKSAKVRPTQLNVDRFLECIWAFNPRFVCIIHSKVRDALVKYANLTGPLTYGMNGAVLPGSATLFVVNYFPNGNAISDRRKLCIFRELRDSL